MCNFFTELIKTCSSLKFVYVDFASNIFVGLIMVRMQHLKHSLHYSGLFSPLLKLITCNDVENDYKGTNMTRLQPDPFIPYLNLWAFNF